MIVEPTYKGHRIEVLRRAGRWRLGRDRAHSPGAHRRQAAGRTGDLPEGVRGAGRDARGDLGEAMDRSQRVGACLDPMIYLHLPQQRQEEEIAKAFDAAEN
jgi:hypothetical protein